MRPDYGPNRCNQCFGPAANPVNDEPVQKVNNVSTQPLKVANGDGQPNKVAEPESFPLTDPTAQKVVEAAQNYARAIEAVSVITGQVKETRELLVALETKLRETKAIAEAAQDELRNATVKPTA